MSLTSYRAAPPRVGKRDWYDNDAGIWCVNGFCLDEFMAGPVFFDLRLIMPGDALLFQRLSVSTIGADRFHGRVRDGIGWVTDAKVTKQYEAQIF